MSVTDWVRLDTEKSSKNQLFLEGVQENLQDRMKLRKTCFLCTI